MEKGRAAFITTKPHVSWGLSRPGGGPSNPDAGKKLLCEGFRGGAARRAVSAGWGCGTRSRGAGRPQLVLCTILYGCPVKIARIFPPAIRRNPRTAAREEREGDENALLLPQNQIDDPSATCMVLSPRSGRQMLTSV